MNRDRTEIFKQIEEITNKEIPDHSITRESLPVLAEILLDIRDCLYEISKTQGVNKWGTKL